MHDTINPTRSNQEINYHLLNASISGKRENCHCRQLGLCNPGYALRYFFSVVDHYQQELPVSSVSTHPISLSLQPGLLRRAGTRGTIG